MKIYQSITFILKYVENVINQARMVINYTLTKSTVYKIRKQDQKASVWST